MRFPRQEYWTGLAFPPPGDLPDSGIKPAPLVSLALASIFLTTALWALDIYIFSHPEWLWYNDTVLITRLMTNKYQTVFHHLKKSITVIFLSVLKSED